jgi:hypothetical protein
MRIIPESKIQQEAVIWFKNTYCLKHYKSRLIIYSVPNGINVPCKPKDRIKALDLLNKTGQLAGVSDLCIIGILGRTVHAECKTQEGTQSEEQIDFENRIILLGGRYFIFRNLTEFQNQISKHIVYLTTA